MARYIDADKVLQSIGATEHCKDCSFNIGLYDCRGHSLSRQDVCDIIEDLCQDTADVVEVVRCKDCVYYEIWELKKDGTDDRRYKPKVCVLHAHLHDKNWYCADAIRKEGGAK